MSKEGSLEFNQSLETYPDPMSVENHNISYIDESNLIGLKEEFDLSQTHSNVDKKSLKHLIN